MEASNAPHFECFSETLNIYIYAMDIEDLFPEGYTMLPSNGIIDNLIPDVLAKTKENAKVGICLYSKQVKFFQRK